MYTHTIAVNTSRTIYVDGLFTTSVEMPVKAVSKSWEYIF